MALVKVRPTSAGVRALVKVVSPELHRGKPHAPLLEKKNRRSGRNNHGRICVRHQGGGHKRHYRVVDFRRDKDGVPGRIEHIEYDPNRSAHLALVLYADGERRYIIAPKGARVDDRVVSGPEAPIKPGNCLPLKNIPVGSTVHCVELKPGRGTPHLGAARATMRSCGCAPARCAGCMSNAVRPSARWGIPGITCANSARPAPSAGAASGPRCAA